MNCNLTTGKSYISYILTSFCSTIDILYIDVSYHLVTTWTYFSQWNTYWVQSFFLKVEQKITDPILSMCDDAGRLEDFFFQIQSKMSKISQLSWVLSRKNPCREWGNVGNVEILMDLSWPLHEGSSIPTQQQKNMYTASFLHSLRASQKIRCT